MGLEARIWASRLEFGPRGLNMGLEARIWASRLELEPHGWNLGLEGVDGEGEEEGEISPKCESIGHRPLRGRCPKKGTEEIFEGFRMVSVSERPKRTFSLISNKTYVY